MGSYAPEPVKKEVDDKVEAPSGGSYGSSGSYGSYKATPEPEPESTPSPTKPIDTTKPDEPDELPAWAQSCPVNLQSQKDNAGKEGDWETKAMIATWCAEWNDVTACKDATKKDTGATKMYSEACIVGFKKPEFDETKFKMDAYTVVDSVADVTLPPTKSPTPQATNAGDVFKTKKVTKKTVLAEIAFPFTPEEISNPSVRKSLTDGVADALGTARENVEISKVGGVAQRRRLADTKIEFRIISTDNSDAAVEQLAKNVEAAALEGSIVANIQKHANANGVLTAALKAMERKQTITTTKEEITVTVTYIEAASPSTLTPTLAPTVAFSSASLPALSAMASAVCLALVTILVV